MSAARVSTPWATRRLAGRPAAFPGDPRPGFGLTCVPWVCTILNDGMLPHHHRKGHHRKDQHRKRESAMPKFVIERELPGAGKLSATELQAISQKSNQVLAGLG